MDGPYRAPGRDLTTTAASTLRQRLAQPSILVAPGAADALTARLIERAGFEAVYVTGAGFANAAFGLPDIGLITLTEVVQHVQRVTDAVRVPVIVDADTGFGNAINVRRSVRALERAGAAAIQIEDQVSPKRCGHFDGQEVISVAEMRGKLAAAVDARVDPDLVLIARTDARAVGSLEATIDRALAYVDAGADVLFVEAPRSRDELARLPAAIGAPLLANMVEGGKTPLLSAAELEQLGYRLVIFANAALRVATHAVQGALAELLRSGTTAGLLDRMVGWRERQELVDLPTYEALERRYGAAEE